MTSPTRLANRARWVAALVALAMALTFLSGFATGDKGAGAAVARDSLTYESAYAAFARAQVARDVPPGPVVDSLRGSVGDDARARARLINSGTPRVYMARTEDGACIAVELGDGASTGCSKDANLLQGVEPPVGVLATGDGRWRVIGVFPDDTTDVRARVSGDQRVAMTPDGNVVTQVFDEPPASLSWTLPDGKTFSLALPNPETRVSG